MAEVGQPEIPSKKRKRTGKQREEAKRLAIARANGEAEDASVAVPSVQPDTLPATEAVGDAAVDEAPAGAVQEAGAGGVQLDQAKADTKPSIDLAQLEKRVPQALKSLHTIFKQARTFEVRRLVKKVKFLRGKNPSSEEIQDLESQLSILSHLPLDPVIQSHFLLKLQKHPKTKSLQLPNTITDLLTSKPTTGQSDPSTSTSAAVLAKVENRLCSSKIASDGVKSVLAWAIGEEGAKLSTKIKPKEPQPKAQVASGGRGLLESIPRPPDLSDEGSEGDDEGESRAGLGADESDDEVDPEDEAADEAGWESGSVGDEPTRGIALGSDDDSGDESGESDSDAAVPIKRQKPTPGDKATMKVSKRDKEVKVKEEAKKVKEKAKRAQAQMPTGPITSSTFLPSLSVGYTLGDSDSDPDLDPDVDGSGMIGRAGPERKNRRGQRARQAIWEKKYGKNAKHVQKAQQAEQAEKSKMTHSKVRWNGESNKIGGQDSGWAEKGGNASTAPAAPAAGAGARFSGPTSVGASRASGPAAGAGAGAGEKMHPSWEAARLRRQKEMGGGAAASAGKPTKIVFD